MNCMTTDKKLFLASFTAHVVDKLPGFIGKVPMETKMAFIPTAADPYTDRWFVEYDRKALSRLGYNFTDFDIKGNTCQSLIEKLSKFDALVLSGGNVFYLMEKAVESGFDKAIPKLIEKGVCYVGGSAGATLVGPSLAPVQTLDDPSKAPNLVSLDGIGIVDFVVLPHFGEIKYKDRYEKIINDYKDFKYRIIPLANDRAVIVNNGSTNVV